MNLQLRYNHTIHPPVTAAFIRGSSPADWLKEIDSWNIPLTGLHCYVIPSKDNTDATGVFVIFKEAEQIKHLNLLDPYACLSKKLYLPLNTELFPRLTEQELASLFIWEIQVFHPSIGFIGFEEKDRLDITALFNKIEPVNEDWSFANPGLTARPPLQSITVIPPTASEVMEAAKEDIGEKELEDIPKNPEDSPSILSKILDGIQLVLFTLMGAIAFIPLLILPKAKEPGKGIRIFGDLQNWIQKKLNDLQQKRDNEIKRLLKLFDKNKDEALKYAIPLDSHYLNRGKKTSSQSSKLTKRKLKFDLGRLGGGGVVDEWDVSNYYLELRQKYLAAAQTAIEQKNYKRAAYIYAHLLADFRSAANVLEQGGMYREAAALYKDHLKNNSAAAECLEKGQLYLEAIELYKPLNRHEKIGDLYFLLNQEANGREYYGKHIDEQLMQNNYLDAARVMNTKLNDTALAKQTLMDGWKGYSQPENCLKNYFDIILEKEDTEVEHSVKEVYKKHTPPLKQMQFLNVLDHVNRKKNNTAFEVTAQDIAYEIVNNEVEKGNLSSLSAINKFLPADKLISSDTSRYGHVFRPDRVISYKKEGIHLEQSIKWIKTVWHRNQFLAIGIKNNMLQMARCNWYGNVEYYSWTNTIKSAHFAFINSPYYVNTIILQSWDEIPITRKNLPKNKYFTESLLVYCPIWMHKSSHSCVINEAKNIVRLNEKQPLSLDCYDMEGKLLKSINCVTREEVPVSVFAGIGGKMISFDNYYYTAASRQFLIISVRGVTTIVDFDTIIRFFAASHSIMELYLVISTNKGCLLCKPSNGDLNQMGDYFASELIPSHIAFVSSGVFIIAEKRKAYAFEITDNAPRKLAEFEVNNLIIGVLPSSDKFKFGLLEESGRLTICEIDG